MGTWPIWMSPGQKLDYLYCHQKMSPNAVAMLACHHVIATVSCSVFLVSQYSYSSLLFLEYFQGLLRRAPVFAPQTTPVYSNTAYRLLGYILGAISGTRFDELLQSSVLRPLNLTTTAYAIPRGEGSWVIPNGESGWYQDTGDETP